MDYSGGLVTLNQAHCRSAAGGTLLGKYGATAVNLSLDPDMVHMHSPIWRLDIDLDGFQGDTVHVASHLETGLPAPDTSVPVSIEGAIDWNGEQFTTLHIHDGTLKNGKGQTSMLHFMPLRWGRPKHQEPFVNRDFWVTRYNGTEMWAKDLPAYAANAQNVANTDVVVWYMGAVHHAPRAEDGELVNGRIEGAAQVMWTGWLLKPHNLFDRTPLYPGR